jgi:GntR family transcriptional regulator
VYCYTDTLKVMFDTVDPRSPVPMYAQIASQVRVAVASGELGNGDPLPSVRMLASQLRVNPATVVQAYRELEGEGVVEMRQGAGTFVASLRDGHRPRARQAEARRLAREILERATRAGITRDELRAAIDSELGGVRP